MQMLNKSGYNNGLYYRTNHEKLLKRVLGPAQFMAALLSVEFLRLRPA